MRRRSTDPDQQLQDGQHPAALGHMPRALVELWDEYQFGIGRRKPAKDWTEVERGNRMHGIKQKYYRRKFVWYTIEELIRRGYTRDANIHRIRSVYGFQVSGTRIIDKVIDDFKNDGHGHPNLVDITSRLRRGRSIR